MQKIDPLKNVDPKIFEPHPLAKFLKFNPKLYGQGYPYSPFVDVVYILWGWVIMLLAIFVGIKWLFNFLANLV